MDGDGKPVGRARGRRAQPEAPENIPGRPTAQGGAARPTPPQQPGGAWQQGRPGGQAGGQPPTGAWQQGRPGQTDQPQATRPTQLQFQSQGHQERPASPLSAPPAGAWQRGRPGGGSRATTPQGPPQGFQGQQQGYQRPTTPVGLPQGYQRPTTPVGPPQGYQRPTTPVGPPQGFQRPTTPVGQPQDFQRPAGQHGPPPGMQRPQGQPGPPSQRPAGPQGPAQGVQRPATPQGGPPPGAWGNIAAGMQNLNIATAAPPAPVQHPRPDVQIYEETQVMRESVKVPVGEIKRDESSGGGILVTRPQTATNKKGTTGNPMDLITNYYKITSTAPFTLHHYHVGFSPDVEMTAVRRAAVKAWKESLKSEITFMYRGDSALYSANRILPTTFLYRDEKGRTEDLHVTIKHVAEIMRTDQQYIQFYNIVVRKICKMLQLTQIRNNYFDTNLTIEIPQYRLELIPGFFQAIAQHESSLLLCVDPIFKVVRQETALDMINSARDKHYQRRGGDADVNNAIKEELVGKIVMTNYSKKTFRVDDIEFGQTPNNGFSDSRTNETISYRQHIKKKFGKEVKIDNQPMLVSFPSKWDVRRGRTGNVMLIPELCNVTGLSDAMRADYTLMTALNVHLQAPPNSRVNSIQKFADRIHSNQEIRAELNQWGLNLEKNMLSLKGRMLPPVMSEVFFKGFAKFQPTDKGDFTQAFRNQHMLSSVRLMNWAVIVPDRDAGVMDNIIRELKNVARPIDFEIANPVEKKVIRPMGARGREEYKRAIKDIMDKHGRNLQLIFVVLPGKQLENYAAVKQTCYSQYGIPSQCMVSKNVNHRNPKSICTKIAIQMNAKLGGEPWGVTIPMGDTMYVGFDVYHPGGKKGPSIAAMAATLNKTCSKYHSNTVRHATSQEMSDNIFNQLSECLLAYKRQNGTLPKRVVFFRDGVGEGQLPIVFQQELGVIKRNLKTLYDGEGLPAVKLAFLVVTKRINTRFFVPFGKNVDNPKPGTIVDDVVTRPESFDFFLVSQDTRQGTVSPTNYNILWDTSELNADKLQILTYKLCFGYFNWSGSLSVPAPCQYAHKLAYLTGTALINPAQDHLKSSLYYL